MLGCGMDDKVLLLGFQVVFQAIHGQAAKQIRYEIDFLAIGNHFAFDNIDIAVFAKCIKIMDGA